jgi:N-formylglutamate amidohydrolase
MFKLDHPQKNPLFDYFAPLGNELRGIISIPHSGEVIPNEFKQFLSGNEFSYKSDVDYKVNELVDIEALQKAGIAVLVAHVHRICVDLNRAESNCVLFWKENTQGEKLVIKDPAPSEVEKFIDFYHRPYFEILRAAIKDLETRKKGKVSMIDLHSMPSSPTEYHMKQNPNQPMHRPDFCLSDRRGKTCDADFINFFKTALENFSHDCFLNTPYIGGYVTEFVDQFKTNNIQIEINRKIYMDEKTKVLIPDKVQTIKAHLTKILIDGFIAFDS